MNNITFPYPHYEDVDIFRESLSYTSSSTGFTETLIEKDYYCSLILHHLFNDNSSLVFKGGTCLSKVHTDFYRLSEDLDFIIPVSFDISRHERRKKIEPIKRIFDKLSRQVPGVKVADTLTGHNESRQYIGSFEYASAVIHKQERMNIEIGLREPLHMPAEMKKARTLAVNPFNKKMILPSFSVVAMSLKEAYSEKIRAALTRETPAIRDIFDLFYAFRYIQLDFFDPDFLHMVRIKLDVPGNPAINISEDWKQKLYRQIEGRLRPVLRPDDFRNFDMDKAYELVDKMADSLSQIATPPSKGGTKLKNSNGKLVKIAGRSIPD